MERVDVCANCRSRSIEDDMNYSCGCGKQGLCSTCGNIAICSQCGSSCCKDCSVPLPCCGEILCGSNGTGSESQSCFANHIATNLSCGHPGCNFSEECRTCILESNTVPSTMSFNRSWNRLAMDGNQPPTATCINQVVPFNGVTSTETTQPGPHKKIRAKRSVRSVHQEPMAKATAPPATTSTDKIRKLPNMSFPQALWKMVTETAKVSPGVISWIENGEAFVVHNPSSRKLGPILHKYFQHGKYSSLQRQLNMYGFKKHTRGRFNGAFHQPLFHRDHPDDVSQILRRPPPSRSSASRQLKPKAAVSSARSSQRLAKMKPKAPQAHIQPPMETPKPRMQESQVLSPNKRIHKKKRSILAKHLPPKKRRIFPQDVENTPIPPVIETSALSSKVRPTLEWSDSREE